MRAQTTPTTPTRVAPDPAVFAPGGIGESVTRPMVPRRSRVSSTTPRACGWRACLGGATLRSPYPRANIWSMDIAEAEEMPGVRRTHSRGRAGAQGLRHGDPDQPVLAWGARSLPGRAVAIVAADHPETARRAVEKIAVEYEVLDPSRTPRRPWGRSPKATSLRQRPAPRSRRARRRRERAADVVVGGKYEIGMQDQAFLGPESGLAVPDGEGGVDLYISTQWLHVDQNQLAESLDLPSEMSKADLSGVGGAFGGREDCPRRSACMLALDTGRPVKMMYNREESFFGHVHRHPCKMRYEHGAVTVNSSRQGPNRLRRGRLRLQLHRGLRKRSPLRRRDPTSVPTLSRGQLRVYTDNLPAARCAASAPCRPASPTSRRWTRWPRLCVWTRSTSG